MRILKFRFLTLWFKIDSKHMVTDNDLLEILVSNPFYECPSIALIRKVSTAYAHLNSENTVKTNHGGTFISYLHILHHPHIIILQQERCH